MFDLPDAKRVRRDQVQSPASSREHSPVDETDLQDAHARLGKLLDLDGLIGANTSAEEDKDATQPADGNNDEDEQEFEFRLFSAPTKPKDATPKEPGTKDGDRTATKGDKTEGKEIKVTTAGTQKLRIRLRSPSPSGDPSEGRFVKAFRGWQYYFSTPSLLGLDENEEVKETIAEQRRQFEDMAVTGEHITIWAKTQPWPGCDLPWRVIHLKRHQTKLPKDIPVYAVEGAPVSKSPLTRKKPGKKRRLQLRKKVAAAAAAKESEAEKRHRKNRERKLKRRQKAREQKAAAGGITGDGDVAMADGDGDSSGADE
ncbi:uncharacterized protein N7473_002752 [Penicillium subrubescens]|uniref:Uncharacterized protein n=1 Tax=Penicillium subrubescens TaxID=1316194 RepID=A0A1Q5UL08_9EURO|nr:uncharacterized protein N7473_002752 [Penicillium subrubescens]KAJ5905836.1 hypothetical protein N7473_002752 [Penicillium subrubescens]OKP13157.1 hypothetical protein PENSUB_1257 [Penicillium subrubescens]